MRTIFAVVLIACIGISGAMVQQSGFGQATGTTPADELESPDRFDEIANEEGITGDGDSGSLSGGVLGGADELLGLIIAGAKMIYNIASMVVLLPVEFVNMGFPVWFAAPAGLGLQLLASIGAVQFVTGRVWR